MIIFGMAQFWRHWPAESAAHGRLLVTLYLCVNGVLRKPLLYLSLYLKTHRTDYYRLLQEVRERGAWEAWLDFFLTGVADTANRAFDAATRIVELFKQDRERITVESDRAGSALRIHDLFQQNPYLSKRELIPTLAFHHSMGWIGSVHAAAFLVFFAGATGAGLVSADLCRQGWCVREVVHGI
ncbi:hypothetical protein AAC691_07320 [Nguyenibacter vanlangensis]|uniref:Uncharacterized protein n=1 Tax=Nguyenibacter vanlangensis TaxID=1216886 RepID=A0ABZ3D9U7_9PROT